MERTQGALTHFLKESPSEGSEGTEKLGRENMYDLRKYLSCQEQTMDRNMNFKCAPGEDLNEKEEHVIRKKRKGSLHSGRKLK